MKKLLAIVSGVIAGFVIVFIGDATVHALNPLPSSLDPSNRNEIGSYITTIPTYVLVVMTIFWLGSSFLGAMLAARINRADWKHTALITGSILMAASILNLALLPHPAWMWITALCGYVPFALLGGWFVRPKTVLLPQ